MLAKVRYYPLYSRNPNYLISLSIMKSFLASFFVSILLISNGMLTTVIDVCCLNENRMYAEADACCAKPVESLKVDCCVKAPHKESKVESHESCEFGSWYYFTPKYLEESTLKPIGSHPQFIFWHHTLSQLLDCDWDGSLSISNSKNAEIAPLFRENRHLLEHHCTWII